MIREDFVRIVLAGLLYLSSSKCAFRLERRTFVLNAVRGVYGEMAHHNKRRPANSSTLQHLTMHYHVREPLRAEEASRICHACAR